MEIKKTCQKNSKNGGNVVVSGRNVEFTQISNSKNNIKWRKLKNNIYVDTETGEFIEKCKSDLKKYKNFNLKSIKQSIKYIRRVINCNFFGDFNERFITLTYADNMQDANILYKDFEKFIKRVKYFLRDNNLKYINIVEPQGRGAWHCHLLLKSDNIAFLTDKICYNLWGKGVTYSSALENIDNVGAYLSAYLTNTKDKKGARLYMYKQNLKIMRCSRNCLKPVKEKISYYDFKKKFKNLKLNYIDSYAIFNKNNEIINSICYKHYEVV